MAWQEDPREREREGKGRGAAAAMRGALPPPAGGFPSIWLLWEVAPHLAGQSPLP